MAQPLFIQNVIALIWDFDKTLIPGDMQDPLLKHYKVDSTQFWEEVDSLPAFFQKQGLDLVLRDTVYLNHILTYVRHNRFKGLNNQLLRELGKQIQFHEGMPEFLGKIKQYLLSHTEFKDHDIRLENYVISSGLRQMILGSKAAVHLDGVWANEFVEQLPLPGYLEHKDPPVDNPGTLLDIGYTIDTTTKTRALFEINKGSNVEKGIHVNSYMEPEDRRVPFQNMIYIADGPSDVPVFSLLNQNGGKTFAVYEKGNKKGFSQVNELQKQKRVQAFGEAIYTEGSHTVMWIQNTVDEIANRIIRDRESYFKTRLGKPPTHLS